MILSLAASTAPRGAMTTVHRSAVTCGYKHSVAPGKRKLASGPELSGETLLQGSQNVLGELLVILVEMVSALDAKRFDP